MKETNAEGHIINCFNKFATFEGKASKSEFWYFFLFYVIAQVISYFIDLNVFDAEDGFGIITILVNTLLFLPMLAVGARRLHDANKSGWWQLLMVTGIGSIPLMIMWCIDGSTKSYVEDNSSSSNRTKSIPKDNNDIQIFDMYYVRDTYINGLSILSKDHNKYIQENPGSFDSASKKKLVKNFKYNFKHKDKYWNTENIYPQNEDDFVDRYFKDRKLDFLEGIWDEENWGLVGIVKEKSYYQHFDINITSKSYDKFQKSHIDYSMVNGTKSGAHIPTSNKKKLKGFGRVVHVRNENKSKNINTKQVWIQSTTTEMIVIDENNLKVKLSGYDNRLVRYDRVWPLDLKEHNKSFSYSPSSKSVSTKNNIAKELKNLKELYNDGTLSKEEFTKAKSKLLN